MDLEGMVCKRKSSNVNPLRFLAPPVITAMHKCCAGNQDGGNTEANGRNNRDDSKVADGKRHRNQKHKDTCSQAHVSPKTICAKQTAAGSEHHPALYYQEARNSLQFCLRSPAHPSAARRIERSNSL